MSLLFSQPKLSRGSSGIYVYWNGPPFKLAEPQGGFFNLSLVLRVWSVIFIHPGLPNQIPYIMTWLSLLFDSSTWLEPLFSPSKAEVILLLVHP